MKQIWKKKVCQIYVLSLPFFFLFGLAVSDILYSEVGRSKFTVKMKFSKKKIMPNCFSICVRPHRKTIFFFRIFFLQTTLMLHLISRNRTKSGKKQLHTRNVAKDVFFFTPKKHPFSYKESRNLTILAEKI